jgi:uncharacterized integral membrane protein
VSEDLEREPASGGDPALSPPDAAPDQDAAAATELAEPRADAATATAPRPTNAGRVWIAIAVATVLLVLLIIFIAENSRSVTISFLGARGHISLALALLIAAVIGATVTLLVGTARILQLRLEVRRGRRAEHRRHNGRQSR